MSNKAHMRASSMQRPGQIFGAARAEPVALTAQSSNCRAGAAGASVVPADDKLAARLFVSHIILETLEKLNMTFPEMTSERRKELQAMRKQLESE